MGEGFLKNTWLIHVNVWQKPLQYCKVISLQLIKINGEKIYIEVSHLLGMKDDPTTHNSLLQIKRL